MQKKTNLQDLFLLRIRQDRLPVTLFLMNGFQMRGIITGYDPFVVVLDSDGTPAGHLQARNFHHCTHPAGGAAGNGGGFRTVNTYEAL